MKLRNWITLTTVLLLTAFIVSFAFSAPIYPTFQVTDNNYYDAVPQINDNGDVVWQGYDGSDYEIFLYDRATGLTLQLTDNYYYDATPQINCNGDVVWRGYDGYSYEIFLYDRTSGATTKLSNMDYSASSPQINCKGDVVWVGVDGYDYEIFLYDKASGATLQLTDNYSPEASPQINDNGDVVWQGHDGLDDEIFLVVAITKVNIDIKPGGNPNNINLKSQGVVPVAVLTTEDFDASTINADSVIFAGASPKRWKMTDVDGDGDRDMLFHFETQDLVELNGDSTEATLGGETSDGVSFEGTDSVNIVPKGVGKRCQAIEKISKAMQKKSKK